MYNEVKTCMKVRDVKYQNIIIVVTQTKWVI